MDLTRLLGQKALGQAQAHDYTNWAEELLAQNADSANVAILASLGLDKYPDAWEVEFYFKAALDDLGLPLPSDEEAMRAYARLICAQVVSGSTPPSEGLGALARIFIDSGYRALYSIWGELKEDMVIVNERGFALFNTGLTGANRDDYIRNVAAQFIELTKVSLPDGFFRLSVCFSCGHLGASAHERIEKPWLSEKLFRLVYRRGPAQKPVCAKCGAPFPRQMSDYEARRRYLDTLR